jgi:hypothetical protein
MYGAYLRAALLFLFGGLLLSIFAAMTNPVNSHIVLPDGTQPAFAGWISSAIVWSPLWLLIAIIVSLFGRAVVESTIGGA